MLKDNSGLLVELSTPLLQTSAQLPKKLKINKYNITSDLWQYQITCENNVIISCSSTPNNRQHWCVGKTLDELKQTYNGGHFIAGQTHEIIFEKIN